MKSSTSAVAVILCISMFTSGCSSTATKETASETPAATHVKPAAPAPAARPAPAAKATLTRLQYTVVPGDHLWGISSKVNVYGNPYEWPLIFRGNRNQIEDADLIFPGEVLWIEKNPSNADVDAAVRHARTRGRWELGVSEKSDREYVAAYAMK